MSIKPIRTEDDYTAAMARIDELWGAQIGTPEGEELEVLALLVGKYEDEHYPMPPSDPIEAIDLHRSEWSRTEGY